MSLIASTDSLTNAFFPSFCNSSIAIDCMPNTFQEKRAKTTICSHNFRLQVRHPLTANHSQRTTQLPLSELQSIGIFRQKPKHMSSYFPSQTHKKNAPNCTEEYTVDKGKASHSETNFHANGKLFLAEDAECTILKIFGTAYRLNHLGRFDPQKV